MPTREIRAYRARNKLYNGHLYIEDKVEFDDYITCPVTNLRMVQMKPNYITGVLGMTVDEFNQKYPNYIKVANAKSKNIKKGINKIDPKTGLTKYEMAQRKARKTLAKKDENGESGYAKKGKKTRATHLSRVDENGRNGYQRQAHGRVTTVCDNGLTVEQNAHIKRDETIAKTYATGSGGASELSRFELMPVLNFLNKNNIEYYFDKQEYVITDTLTGDHYYFDLTIPVFKTAIEYQSNAWHSNPFWPAWKWNNWKKPMGNQLTAEEKLNDDYTKARALYRERGYCTFFVWQDSSKADVEGILCWLETQNTKYLLQLDGETSMESN